MIQAYRNSIRYTDLLAGAEKAATAPPIDELVALGLTRRQAEVLQALATGAGEREIAERLSISRRTVQKHLERCYRRLGVNSRSRAAGIAWATIDPDWHASCSR